MTSQATAYFTWLLLSLAPLSTALNAYGHAYRRPNDFTPDQYAAIASRFGIFTVEKDHAAALYSNKSAPAHTPGSSNSIAASVGTARKIKALNSSVKVLMYWNSILNFNFYECESDVESGWLMPNPNPREKVKYYNYSVPAFRTWWVQCAIDAVRNSNGALDGLFLDATPKVDNVHPSQLHAWGHMVDRLRAALGDNAILINNGFFLTPNDQKLAGEDAWAHTGLTYTESLTRVGGKAGAGGADTPLQGVQYLLWLAQASSQYPKQLLIGHGSIALNAAGPQPNTLDPLFLFGLAKYLLVTSSVTNGWFLANNGGYSIDDGLLAQPMTVYNGSGVGCGEPIALVKRTGGAGSFQLSRSFQYGTITVDVKAKTASIDCKHDVQQELTRV